MKTVKDKLYHFEETPPPGIWDNLSQKLEETKVVSIEGRQKTRTTALFTAAAAVIVLLIISVAYFDHGTNNTPQQAAAGGFSDSVEKNNEMLEAIINAPAGKKSVASRKLGADGLPEYFTIEGPEGEPVRISPKVATLILSSDNEYPPKPVWDKQITEWQNIMLSSSVSPSSARLIEIIQQASNTIQ